MIQIQLVYRFYHMSFYTISAEATATKVNDAGEDGQDAEGGKREGQGDAGGD